MSGDRCLGFLPSAGLPCLTPGTRCLSLSPSACLPERDQLLGLLPSACLPFLHPSTAIKDSWPKWAVMPARVAKLTSKAKIQLANLGNKVRDSCLWEGQAGKASQQLASKMAKELRCRQGDADALKTLNIEELGELTESLAQAVQAASREHRRKCRSQAEEVLCIACCENRRTVVLRPCCHMVLCMECFERAGQDCPQCRTTISGYTEVFT